ncbi:hypothetical protein ACSFCX_03755 [Yokenella regensburgei]|uniref:hypothetical protein n=1 Tax=Yokenella regensburgei TaxID=158877 RepID=UPI003ED9AC09
MTLKDWTDLFTGGGAVISAIAAGVAAWASRTSAKTAKESSEVTSAMLAASERTANNDWRIRLLEERMKVWRAFDDLMIDYTKRGVSTAESIARASAEFQRVPFLFPAEVDDYLRKLQKRLFRQMTYEARRGQIREGVPWKENYKEQEKELNLCKWLGKQQKEGKAIFQKHMSLID